MPAYGEMNIDERRKYLKRMAGRYVGGDRKARNLLLTEMEAVIGLHRKSLIRLLGEPTLDRQP
ncbi:MAG: integrase, partial [Dehalococcoidia bacterium]|nr:integrase [Dehalococcoidia bacterium]